MKSKFEKLLKGIFISSVSSLVAINGANAAPYDLSKIDDNDNKIEFKTEKENAKKYILKMYDDDSYSILGHRSHSSHRSHRSHSSHRSSSSGSYSSSPSSSSSTTTKSTSTTTVTRTYDLGDRTITSGVKGSDVKQLADMLIDLNYITHSDLEKDTYGNVTYTVILMNAVKKFQKEANLTADGIVGKQTIKELQDYSNNATKLASASTTPKINLGDRVLKKGMDGHDVTQLKNILIDKKFMISDLANGISTFDEDIELAVKKFQQSIGIEETGIVDVSMIDFLRD
jgi:murein L,D-transpeptidase YcbB/YkuD